MGQMTATRGRRTALCRWSVWWPFLLVALLPVLAHLPEIGGWVTCNPFYGASGLMGAMPPHLLPGRCTIDGNVGGTLQALGGAAANSWLAGTVPWWTSDVGLGLPLAAEAQPAAFFLPFVILLHHPSGVIVLKLLMQILAGLFTCLLLRELGFSRSATVIGGVVFALNGSFAWFSHSMILPVAFLPVLVFGIERSRSLAAAGQAGGTLWIALGMAYGLAAGFPETAFMDGLLAGLWAICALWRVPAGRRIALAGKIAVGGCAGLALSAPAWLSFIDLLPGASIGAHVFVVLNQLSTGQAAALLFPGLYGPPFMDFALAAWSDDGGYFGPEVTCLAVVALCGGIRLRGLRRALGGWIAFWLCAFFGEPLSHAIWATTPVLNQVQMTRYAMPSMEFAAAVLAALAVDDWRRSTLTALRAWAGVTLTAVLGCMVLLLAARAGRLAWSGPVSLGLAAASLTEAAVVLTLLSYWLVRPPGRARSAALATCVVVGAVAHFTLPELAGDRPARQMLGAARYLHEHAGLTRVFTVGDQVPVNYGAWLGFSSIQADLVPAPLEWTRAAVRLGGEINMSVSGLGIYTTVADQVAALRGSATRLQAAGVGYVVTAAPGDPFVADPLQGMALAYDDGRSRVYALPHAPYAGTQDGSCRLRIESRLRQLSDCAAPATLVRRELSMTGWHVRVNGKKAPVGQADGMFQSVALPAGHADITWLYRPPHLRAMVALSVLGALATVALCFRRKGRVF